MMEIAASTNYLPELGMEDPSFLQYPMDYFACLLDELDFQSLSGCPKESYSSPKYLNSESTENCFPVQSPDQLVAPTKKRKTFSINSASWNTCKSDLMAPKSNASASASASPSSQLISFAQPSSLANSHHFYNLDSDVKPKIENACSATANMDFSALNYKGAYEDKSFPHYDKLPELKTATMTTRNPIQAQDHVMAERKRREKLSQRFIALSAIVPGLKKMDKASVLGDAIKYLKQLKERVQSLEEQVAKKKVESAVIVKRSFVLTDDENCESHCDQPLPEIEARVCGEDVLIRIHCDKHRGPAPTILSQLEKHHLTVKSSSFLPFGNFTFDITIIAQMNKEYCMTAKDLAESLRQALRKFI